MANILLFAQGHKVGKSVFDEAELSTAKDILRETAGAGTKFVLPLDDVAVAKSLDSTERREVKVAEVADDDYILDFGRNSVNAIKKLITEANTIIWNGPLGYYENPAFAIGSQEVAKAIAAHTAESIVGGGDTAEVVNALGLANKFTHVSTGGGASLDFMSGKKLPGIEALLDK